MYGGAFDTLTKAGQGWRNISKWVYDQTKGDPSLYSIPVVGGWLYDNNRAQDNMFRSQSLKNKGITPLYSTSDPGAIGNAQLGGVGDSIIRTAGRTSRTLAGTVEKATYHKKRYY